ncbi:DUF4190 domain-containing protein [Streptomyces sp. NPDC014864]|uniref:DUF4190 domain-containing protein n=1 Tax=Streptomyces sp. NPDC014864 TaxID=3364924 RepID=UPI0036FE32CE
MRLTAPPRQRTGKRDTEGMAIASFVLGLVGLVVLNLVLGPVAIVLAVVALRRDTPRRFRAWLGLALGVTDLLLLAVLLAVHHGTSWTAFG